MGAAGAGAAANGDFVSGAGQAAQPVPGQGGAGAGLAPSFQKLIGLLQPMLAAGPAPAGQTTPATTPAAAPGSGQGTLMQQLATLLSELMFLLQGSAAPVSRNEVHQAGDDAFSDDSYASDAKQDTGNAFTGNLALDSAYGRGFALMGSANDTLQGNVSSGTPGNGIIAGTDGDSGTRAGSGDTIKGNTVIAAKDTAIQAAGMDVSGNTADGAAANLAAALGWTPAAGLADRSQIAPGYQPGTGNGANNSGSSRT